MSTYEKTVSELCQEVDYWKSVAQEYKEKYEAEKAKYGQFLDDTLKSQKQQLGQILSFALQKGLSD